MVCFLEPESLNIGYLMVWFLEPESLNIGYLMVWFSEPESLNIGYLDPLGDMRCTVHWSCRAGLMGTTESPYCFPTPHPPASSIAMGPKYRKYRLSMVSVLGIVFVIWGIYFLLCYLDP